MNVGPCCRLRVARAAVVAAAVWIGSGAAGAQGLSLEIGQNFTAATHSTSGYIPPDVMGAVGPQHVVQLINGEYRVYRKSDGVLLQQTDTYGFWVAMGIMPTDFSFDPRVVYDSGSGRWFAVEVDAQNQANNYLFAVSRSGDPTDGWTGFTIASDSTGNSWADFSTLGVDADGVYLAATHISLDGQWVTGASVVVLPKADLLGPTPSIVNATLFELPWPQLARGPQFAVDLDGGGLPMPIIATTGIAALAQFAGIEGPVTAPSLSGVDGTGIVDLPFAPTAAPAEQPGPSQNLDICCGDSRFNSNFVIQNGALWAVRAVDVSGRAGVEWFQIDPDTNTILQTGRITDDELEFYYPSIAVNEFDQVVVGFNGSSESQFVSAYAAVGETVGGVTSFGDPLLLKEGVDSYEVVFDGRNRWGDYSTTVVDPSDPSVFWTFQEWADFGGSNWATQITQLRVVPEPNHCSDGLDNDGDGLVDLDDPGCVDGADLDERDPLLPCDDGADNDGDGRIDFDPVTFANPGDQYTLPAGVGDPGCKNPTWSTESPQCQDGINNDLGQDPNPGKIDYDAGYSANGSPDANGPDPQCVGKPWKNQERKPANTCGLGVELALLLPPLMWLFRKRSRTT